MAPTKKSPNKKPQQFHKKAHKPLNKPFKPKSKPSDAVESQAVTLHLEDEVPDFPRGTFPRYIYIYI